MIILIMCYLLLQHSILITILVIFIFHIIYHNSNLGNYLINIEGSSYSILFRSKIYFVNNSGKFQLFYFLRIYFR